jgi:hypothetical protein
VDTVTDQTGRRDPQGDGLISRLRNRLRGGRDEQPTPGPRLAARVAALEDAVEENRRLNQRLADVVDVVTEVLVPAADRDDERLRAALKNLNRTLDDSPTDDDR